VKVASGLVFLVLQAAHAIRFWTGRKPPLRAMLRAVGAEESYESLGGG